MALAACYGKALTASVTAYISTLTTGAGGGATAATLELLALAAITSSSAAFKAFILNSLLKATSYSSTGNIAKYASNNSCTLPGTGMVADIIGAVGAKAGS